MATCRATCQSLQTSWHGLKSCNKPSGVFSTTRQVWQGLLGRTHRGGVAPHASQTNNGPQQEAQVSNLSYEHLLLAILDENPYLGDGSKQACATAATLAVSNTSRLTVLLVDETQKEEHEPRTQQLESISWHLKQKGCDDFKFFEKKSEHSKGQGSVVVGDVADEVDADLVILSSSAVHDKLVDANLLAEFVPCPVLLLP